MTMEGKIVVREDMYGNKAIALHDLIRYNRKLKYYAAVLTGLDDKYTFKRVFIKLTKLAETKDAAIRIEDIKEGQVIEVHGESWKHRYRKYYVVNKITESEVEVTLVGHDSDLRQVIRLLKEREQK